MHLRAATPEDLEKIYEIETRSESNPWTLQMFSDELGRGDRGLFWVLEAKTVIGFAVFDLLFPEADLLNVALSPSERGKGFGRHLIEGCVKELQERGFERVLLEVRASNDTAIRLYERLGFKIDAKRPNYYDHPREDAILMSWVLCG